MSKRGKRRGHFCWCCGRIRPNERFSGRGHARHLCRDCAKLGAAEVAYRQATLDIDRLVGSSGLVRRKQRKSFERFLSDPDERVRAYAARVAALDAEVRQELRRARLDEELEEELAWEVAPGPVRRDGETSSDDRRRRGQSGETARHRAEGEPPPLDAAAAPKTP